MRTFTEFYIENRKNIDAVLFDVDGTLAVGSFPIPGAKELLELLEKDGCPYFLLTNDGCHSRMEKALFLKRANLAVSEKNILSSGNALKWWAERHYNGGLFFQSGNFGEPNFAAEAGIAVTREPALAKQCCGVLMGEGAFDWRLNLEVVFNMLLHHPEYPVITANPDSYWAMPDGKSMGVGSGALTRFICGLLKEAGVTVEPVYLGKPYLPIYECVYSFVRDNFPGLEIRDPKRVMMVGDSLASDIRGGNGAGFTTCLVLTGITTPELVEQADADRRPDEIFKSV